MSVELDSPATIPGFIEQPLGGLSAWADSFDPESLPVLRRTAILLEDLRSHEDSVDAHLLAEAFSQDPLVSLKVLARVAQIRKGRDGSDPETLTAAFVMLGITPFFRDFGPQSIVEDVLGQVPDALDGFMAVLKRSHRAARFALAFAVQRMDRDAAVIHDAALLHDFVELLMWLRAPRLAHEVRRRLAADASLRSRSAQCAVFNIELPELQHALMVRWRLPTLLTDISDDHREGTSIQARNVVLSIRLARHTELSWDNAALPDDVREIADLLNLSYEPALTLLKDIDETSI